MKEVSIQYIKCSPDLNSIKHVCKEAEIKFLCRFRIHITTLEEGWLIVLQKAISDLI